MRVAVLGAGMWGTAFACLLSDRGHDVTLTDIDRDVVKLIAETGRNPRHLPQLDLGGIKAITLLDAPGLMESTDLVVVAVPSHAFASAVHGLGGSSPVLSLTKGLDPASGRRLSQLVGERPVAAL